MGIVLFDYEFPDSCNECPFYRGFSVCLLGGFNELKESSSHRQPWCKIRDLVDCAACVHNVDGVCRHPYLPSREVWDGDYCSHGDRKQEEI